MNSSNSAPSETKLGGESASSNPPGDITVAGAKQRIKVSARDVIDNAKQAASATFDRAKEATGQMAADQKRETAEKISGYSSVIHDSAKSLEEKDPNIAWFTHRAADRLQSVADYVRERDFSGLRRDVEDVARRHPLAVIGGLFIAGVIVGNLIKATGPRTDLSNEESPGSKNVKRDEEVEGAEHETASDSSSFATENKVSESTSDADRPSPSNSTQNEVAI